MKKILIFLMVICLVLPVFGCAKCISTEYEDVEVSVVDEYYKKAYTKTKRKNGKTKRTHYSAVYQITVEYNGDEFVISDKATYEKYKYKVGESATGTLRTRTYDDGTVKYDITELE